MTRMFTFNAVIFAFCFITESSTQLWRQHNGFVYPQRQSQRHYSNYYQPIQHQQLNEFQNHFQSVSDISISEAEWICKNPKTGDMMIISSEQNSTSSTEGNDKNDSQSSNTSKIQQLSNNNPLNLETVDSKNTSGEEVIDIRLGKSYN